MRSPLLTLVLLACLASTGCYATKVVSVPLRVTGAVASAVPFVGNTVHDRVDDVADIVDDVGP